MKRFIEKKKQSRMIATTRRSLLIEKIKHFRCCIFFSTIRWLFIENNVRNAVAERHFFYWYGVTFTIRKKVVIEKTFIFFSLYNQSSSLSIFPIRASALGGTGAIARRNFPDLRQYTAPADYYNFVGGFSRFYMHRKTSGDLYTSIVQTVIRENYK